MSIEDQILALMGQPDYTPKTIEEIGRLIGNNKSTIRLVRKAMPRLLASGSVAKVKKNAFCLPSDADLASGTIMFRQSGAAKLLPDPTPEKPNPEPINIRAEDTGIALHGDKVLVRIYEGYQRQPRKPRDRRPGDEWRNGRVIRILERAFDALPGTLRKTRLFWYILPDDPRIGRDIIVQDPAKSNIFPIPKEDDKVVVRIVEWKQRHLSPVGEIMEVLGKTHTPLAEYKAVLYKYKLSPDFPDAVNREAAAIPERVDPKEAKGRLDYRDIFTITIDPDDAKDFDDALSIETLPNGSVRVGIHIADVSNYVRPGSALDKEARQRGNSTYLVGTVIPMLPHALSSGLCSLVEAEDRLTKSVLITYDKSNRPVDTRFANTIIRSRKRLTYKQALSLLKWSDLDKIRALPAPPPHQTGYPGRPLADLNNTELKELQDAVRTFWKIAATLRRARMAKGSLDLDMPEVKIYCDADGYADRVVKNESDESHQLIEEFMLAANEAVARALFQAKLPNISRVHDEPAADRLGELRQELLNAGIRTGDLTKRPEVLKLLATLKETPDSYPLQIAFLRSMRQACYRASPDGHYGLAKKYYSHFTSPIRRYADLVEHRILDCYLQKVGDATAPARKIPPPSIGELELVSQHLSRTERNSAEAERETVKIKLLELFERELEKPKKTAFDAIITEVRNHGLYVELTDSQAFGLVHISTLTDDLYHIDEAGTAIVGRKSKNTYKLGQHVNVNVDRVDRYKRQVDFRIVPDAEAIARIRSKETPKSARREGRIIKERKRR
ncbi:MAG: RNB domain-containing ribonuclease [Puniceicoccales bacterium]|jgi:ribonuclease R|nr:RNB domain-containing ribonuclease [Puniceicoccales bacterium]